VAGPVATERHYTLAEVASMWGLCWKTIRKLFDKEPGIVVIGHAGDNTRNRYQTVRIPESVLVRVYQRMRQT
jgi:hypothetical protein